MARVIRQKELRSLVKEACHAARMRRAAPAILGNPLQHSQQNSFSSSRESGMTKGHFRGIWRPVGNSRAVEDSLEPTRSRGFLNRTSGVFFSNVSGGEAVVTEITETVSVSPEAESKVVSMETELGTASQGNSVLPDSSSPLPKVSTTPKFVSDREIQPGRVYIAGLPLTLKGDEVKKFLNDICSSHGNVKEIKLGQHSHMSARAIEAGRHRGFAFVTMESPEQVREVIDKVDGATAFDGRVLRASFGLKDKPIAKHPKIDKKNSPFRRTVFVGNLLKSTTDQELALHFLELGAIEDVTVLTELHSERSRGFGFVRFEKEEQALQAVRDKNGSSLDGSPIVVNIAKYRRGY